MTRSDTKTPAQLEAEIQYYAMQLRRTTSADRKHRAHVAIQVRERQLVEARRTRVMSFHVHEVK